MSTILLADDRDETREAYAALLRASGYTALCASNGHEACMLARDLRPDLIVMDLEMPVLSGWDAARILKSDPSTADIPIVALSAVASPEEAHPGHSECGFDDVWTKPFPPDRLMEEAERRVRAREAA